LRAKLRFENSKRNKNWNQDLSKDGEVVGEMGLNKMREGI
jgi:hypothetical protein